MSSIESGARIIAEGGVIAYPTEACFGIGCDPKNEDAIRRILQIKNRPSGMGLILIADCFDRLIPYVDITNESILEEPLASWPGPYTWIFPANTGVAPVLSAKDEKIAVRVTAHPIAAALCEQVEMAIVSTSANRHGMSPTRSYAETVDILGADLDCVVQGDIGDQLKPTWIRDAVTGETIRAA